MSGGTQQAKGAEGRAPARITSVSTLIDAVVCFRGTNNAILINVPFLHEQQQLSPEVWQHQRNNSNTYAAASILADYLLNHRKIVDDGNMARLLSQTAPMFTAEFIDVLPAAGGVIPISIISDWLERRLREFAPPLHIITDQSSNADGFDWDDWNDIAAAPFAQFGFVCSRNYDDRPITNITQRIWFRPDMKMDWQGCNLTRLTLAANVIDQYVWTCSGGMCTEFHLSRNIEEMYEQFIADFVQTMPTQGGQIPLCVMRDWLFRNS